MEDFNFISRKLIGWYEVYKRDLPWRGIHDPYKIWISEIILQQTRVVQGLAYYNRFIERFPDVHALARAEEQEVLKYWQGLGYYSRARNLHFAARTVETEFHGKFPKDYESVRLLKGIGEYTAAAIVSFAYNLPYPVVDGNVFRFLSRLFAIDEPIDTGKGKKLFTELSGGIMDKSRPGISNQAIMEFGALQCIPSLPDCRKCPLLAQCLAYKQNKIPDFPVKSNKTKTQERYLYYFHIHCGNYFYLKKREGNGIWRNLYEFPLIESETPLEFEDLAQHEYFRGLFSSSDISRFKLVLKNRKHVLTHRILFANFYEVSLEKETEALLKYQKVKPDGLDEYPIHRLMQIYLESEE